MKCTPATTSDATAKEAKIWACANKSKEQGTRNKEQGTRISNKSKREVRSEK
jgi:hypothetical protein